MRTLILGCLLGLTLAGPSLGQGRAERRAKAAASATHGGKLHRTQAHRFEVVYGEDTIRVYAYDAKGEAVSARGIRGRASVLIVRATTGGARRGVGHQSTGATLSYRGASAKKGRLRDCLVAKHSIGKVELQGVRVDVTLSNVADEPKGKVEFRVEFAAGSVTPTWACTQSGCSKTIFVDPGSCPKCDGRLRRREWAERVRGAAADREQK